MEFELTQSQFQALLDAKFIVPTRQIDDKIEYRLTHEARVLLGQLKEKDNERAGR